MRVVYITCDSKEWHDIAAQMERSEAWQPVYWICEPNVQEMLERRFPGVITHSRYDAYHMVNPPALAGLQLEPLDEPFIRDMAENYLVAMKMMDVMDSVDAFDFNERRRFFHQRLQYWRAVLKAVQPDLCVFAFSAHVVYDHAVYALCRYYGIRTIMFETTYNWALYLAEEDPMVGSTELQETYAQLLAADDGGEIQLPEFFETYLTRLRGKYDEALPWYLRSQLDAFPKDIAATIYRGGEPDRRSPMRRWRDYLGR